MVKRFDVCSNFASTWKDVTMVSAGFCFAIFRCRKSTSGRRRGKCRVYGWATNWGPPWEEIPVARAALGRRAWLIVGRVHIRKSNLPVALILLQGIEVVEHRKDPAMSTGEVFDATYPVDGDWHRSVQAASWRLPYIHAKKPTIVVLDRENLVGWD